MRGLTWSPRALGSGVSRPTVCVCWLRQQAQALVQDVPRSVYIPVVVLTALWAGPENALP